MKYGVGVIIFILISCNSASKSIQSGTEENKEILTKNSVQESNKNLTKAYFASGCFWCVEAIYEHTKGVKEVYSGYSGGHTKNPTYESSNTGKTGHAEAVEVVYDSTLVSFKELVDIYFGTQNIEQINGQGNDIGSQYRSLIFYSNAHEKAIIETKVSNLQSKGLEPAVEIKKFEKFWIAEKYHQDYEKLHPNHPYIQSVSVPRLNRFKKKFPELVKE